MGQRKCKQTKVDCRIFKETNQKHIWDFQPKVGQYYYNTGGGISLFFGGAYI